MANRIPSRARKEGPLYELVGPLREMRKARGWNQEDLASIARLARPNVSIIECGLTRIGEAKARRICDALDIDLGVMFQRVLPCASAASVFGVDMSALRAAALDEGWTYITAHAIEKRGSLTRLYFTEERLREQLAGLPTCKALRCTVRALRPTGYCADHKWMASRERIRRAVARPSGRRLWLTEAEAAAEVRRAWETVRLAIRDGELRAFRVSGHVLVPKRDLAEWAEMLPIRYGMHRPTRLELALRTLLDSLGVEFHEQHPIGNYKVDAYVPRIGLVIEADGSYWHRNEAKEKRRDAYLLRNPLVRSVVHLTDEQLAPWTPKDRHSREYRTAIAA